MCNGNCKEGICCKSDSLTEKKVIIGFGSSVPIKVIDDTGKIIGSARVKGDAYVTILIDKHHPASLNLEIENGLDKLELKAFIEGTEISGSIVIN